MPRVTTLKVEIKDLWPGDWIVGSRRYVVSVLTADSLPAHRRLVLFAGMNHGVVWKANTFVTVNRPIRRQ